MLIPDASGQKRRHDGLNAYKVKGRQEYLLVRRYEPGPTRHDPRVICGHVAHKVWMYPAFAALTSSGTNDRVPPMCHTDVASVWLSRKCRPVSWAEIPPAWQAEFSAWVHE